MLSCACRAAEPHLALARSSTNQAGELPRSRCHKWLAQCSAACTPGTATLPSLHSSRVSSLVPAAAGGRRGSARLVNAAGTNACKRGHWNAATSPLLSSNHRAPAPCPRTVVLVALPHKIVRRVVGRPWRGCPIIALILCHSCLLLLLLLRLASLAGRPLQRHAGDANGNPAARCCASLLLALQHHSVTLPEPHVLKQGCMAGRDGGMGGEHGHSTQRCCAQRRADIAEGPGISSSCSPHGRAGTNELAHPYTAGGG